MKIIIDRFEGDFAVCELEDKSFVNVPRVLFGNAKEGDIFNIQKDDAAKDKQMEKARSLFDKLKKK